MPRHRDDPELVRSFRAGDDAAFEAIVARHRPRLLTFARRLLASRGDDADDVVQEALVRAHRALRRDDRPMRLGAWLTTLTRNCCLDELARRHDSPVDLSLPGVELALVDPRSPDSVAEQRANLHDMLDGIAALPSTQRHALVRHQVDGATHREIADELGITPLASRSLVFCARQALVEQHAPTADERCEAARRDLLASHHAGGHASARSHRHLVTCPSCRAYRARLRASRRAIQALAPGPLLFATVGLKGALAAAKASGTTAAGAAKATAGTTGVLAVLGVAAVGGTIFAAGQPSPLNVKSPTLPGGVVRAGTPLPPGTAMVTKAVRLTRGRADVTLACPDGMRVADLLAPNDGRVTAAFAAQRSSSRWATIVLASRQLVAVGVAVLCRQPDATGALVASPSGRTTAFASQRVATVCIARAFLRYRVRGRPDGSVALGEPVELEGRRGLWLRVRTQFGALGWLRAPDLCG